MFTAQGDMRQALNNLQATFHGFGTITPDNVFKVCCFVKDAHIRTKQTIVLIVRHLFYNFLGM